MKWSGLYLRWKLTRPSISIYILNYILTKREPGVTPRTEKVRGRRPGDGGDDPEGITVLMGKLGLRRKRRVNLIN